MLYTDVMNGQSRPSIVWSNEYPTGFECFDSFFTFWTVMGKIYHQAFKLKKKIMLYNSHQKL